MNEVAGTPPYTVFLGGMRKEQLLCALRQHGVRLNEIAQALFAHQGFETSNVRFTVEITDVSVAELGCTDGATLEQVFERAAKRDLAVCPLELAAHLRLQFADQPEGFVGYPSTRHCAPPGSLTIAAWPLTRDDGMPMGFYLRRIRGVLWLRGYISPADHIWAAGDRFVFCRTRSAAHAGACSA